jgi:HD-like signal output (HDOD) protein
MVFALGGQQALDALASASWDVIVSDMRMPGIDGVAVLQFAKDRHPHAVRIVLSGHAEREAVVKALRVAHQFLSKPCTAAGIRSAIDRACELQSLLQDEAIRRVVGNVQRLPSVPHTYLALTRAAAHPGVGLAELAAIVEQDPAMAAKVLQLVNSSYFGLGRTQSSLQGAVNYLGAELLKALALTAHVFDAGAGFSIPGFSLESLQRRSVLVARLAQRFFADKEQSSDVFTAAILHGIGKILLAMSVPEAFAAALEESRLTGRPAHVVEKALIGTTHAAVGAYLLGLWGLPLGIVHAVAQQHDLDLAEPNSTAVGLHVAVALSGAGDDPAAGPSGDDGVDIAFVERSPFAAELPRWRRIAEEARGEAAGEP